MKGNVLSSLDGLLNIITMMHLNETIKKLSVINRLSIALSLFGIALLFRFVFIPHISGGPFVTFYPAIILAFYLCGGWAGTLVAMLSGLVGLYFFMPPYGQFNFSLQLSSSVVFFAITSTMIGLFTTLLLRQIEQLNVLLDNELIGSMMLRNRKIVWCNRGMSKILGYTQAELVGASTKMLYADEAKYDGIGDEAYPIEHGKPYRTQFEMRKSNGQTVWIDISGAAIAYDPTLTLWLVNDISKLKDLEEELSHQVNHDFLTGLSSRSWFMRQAEIELHRAIRYSNPLSVLMLDIDFFKRINDTHGHQSGDVVLKCVADLCKHMLRDSDVCGRLGGEEFALLLPETNHHQAYIVAERLRTSIEKAKVMLPTEDVTLQLTVSIGVATLAGKTDEVEAMVARADKALYEAKHSGRNRVFAS
jgi:diguanylate cyclase (GGDEF)-like protein/PAS domain S-box-containing protein